MSVPDLLESAFALNKPHKFYGKYRGSVVNNIDPLQRGRIQALVPDVSSTLPTSWAMPAVPVAGSGMGVFVLPPVGAGVWIEFEQGDPDYPIWSGGWWGNTGEVPALALTGLPASPSIVLQTLGGNIVMISDLPGPSGGILLQTKSGAMLSLSDTGITISDGQGATISLTGAAVTINQGALVVQ